ncbi:hypothetical protein WJR50_29310 [Catalinimonas sp. 4WD22]|uniref:hypothetical protein n=1 Tax=Catalinimonas locisalis TaxID=3133978 RepID=UPI003100C77F
MISQFIPLQKKNKKGVFIAVLLFILQFVYFQMQDVVLENVLVLFSSRAWEERPFLLINHPENLFKLLHVFVHAIFSIAIVWYLFRDRQSTWLVVYLSVILLSTYLITNLVAKAWGLFVIDVISTKIYLFIASPFKTIFSIPALKIKH